MSKILVVDDMAVFREPIAAALRQAGYETLSAANGKEALDLVRDEKPDLILLDLSMPVMDGQTFLEKLRADSPKGNLPIILLTANADKEVILQCAKLGIRDYLLKSQFSNSDLVERVAKYLPRPQSAAVIPSAPAVTDHQELAQRPSGRDSPQTDSSNPVQITPVTETGQAHSLQELKPIMPRSEIKKLLDDCGELKGLSPTVAQILKITSNARCSIEQVTKVIKQDHAISLKILKLANSSVYTRGKPVDSVHNAIMRIGLVEIRQTVMNISVIENFSGNDNGRISMPQFWEHSIACGLIAAELVHSLEIKDISPDMAFTMGLLHDVGRIVYLDMLGSHYEQVIDTAQRLLLPLEQVESRMLLINHADAMDRILHTWRFPKELIDPITFHQLSMNVIRGQSAKMLNKVAVLAMANRLAHALLLGNSGNQAIYAVNDFVQALGADAKILQKIEDDIPSQTDDIKFSMLAQSHMNSWKQYSHKVRERFNQPFRPLFVSDDPDTDALRIFCNRLKGAPSEEDSPTIGVIHIKKGREISRLTRKYLEAEKKTQTPNLPLILLSPNGKLTLEDKTMENRRCLLLPIPFTIPRFVQSFHELAEPELAVTG